MNAPSRSVFAAGLEAIIGILRFRKGPEDVPASTPLLVASIAGVVLLNLMLSSILPSESTANPLVLLLIDLGISLLGLLLILRAAGHPERFGQTVTAIFGCQIVLAPAIAASTWILASYVQPGAKLEVPVIPAMAVGLWMLIITARILRSATSWPLFACVFLIFSIEVATQLVILGLYPPPAAAAGAAAAAA